MQISLIILALGGNVRGRWGRPADAFRRALDAITRRGLVIVACSDLYETAPVGGPAQPAFLNAVVGCRGSVAPGALLRQLKTIEATAGRRVNGRWGPRPLDIDILDMGGRMLGRSEKRSPRGRLILPHPELARRGFVLVPLVQVAPKWTHPRLHVTAESLLKRSPRLGRGVRRVGSWTSAV